MMWKREDYPLLPLAEESETADGRLKSQRKERGDVSFRLISFVFTSEYKKKHFRFYMQKFIN